jgi:hypothetical protein
LSVVEREFRVCGEKGALPELWPHLRKTARETRQGIKQAVVGKYLLLSSPRPGGSISSVDEYSLQGKR